MKTIYFSNTGCSIEEEEFIRLKTIIGAKQTNNLFKADYIVQHFCGMSSECFEDIPKFMYVLEKLKEDNPNIKVFVGGCASTVVDLQKRYPFVDCVFSRHNMTKDICEYLGLDSDVEKVNSATYENSVVIQRGCLRHCGFCKKHYMEMPLNSKPISKILDDIDQIIKKGYTDIVLLAENSTEYGIDLGTSLIELLRNVETIKDIKSIYLTALCIDELVHNTELVEYIQNSNKITNVQLEIQSLIPEVRKNMNISSTTEDVVEILRKFAKKHIETNIMLGYPGETQKEFEKQLNIIKEENLYYVQINVYDNTPGTPSYLMPQVNKNDVAKRVLEIKNLLTKLRRKKAEELIKISAELGCTGTAIGKNVLHLNGECVSVIVDTDKEFDIGDIIKVRLNGIDDLFSGREQILCLKGELYE